MAKWIIKHFPQHVSYVEPCGGAASVLLQKPRSPMETYNDLDGNVVNFFRVLRDRPDELIRKIQLTPWARSEYDLSLQPCEDELESARRFFSRLWLAISASPTTEKATQGFRVNTQKYNGTTVTLHFDDLLKIAERFANVQIENKQALEIIERFDYEKSLIYFDPPYQTDERSHTAVYQFEWSDDEHVAAANALKKCSGYVVVSGYACQLYANLYEAHGWKRVDKAATTNGKNRVESLWLSPRTVAALNMPHQASLFGGSVYAA